MPSDETAFLNAMGTEGWKLAGVRGDTFYFMRPLVVSRQDEHDEVLFLEALASH